MYVKSLQISILKIHKNHIHLNRKQDKDLKFVPFLCDIPQIWSSELKSFALWLKMTATSDDIYDMNY